MSSIWIWIIAVCAVVCASTNRGGSSLRGALEALQRRQRGRVHGPILPKVDYDTLYEYMTPQGYPDPDYSIEVEDTEEEPSSKYIIKLLDENDRTPSSYEYKLIKKKNVHTDKATQNSKKESAFRERTHQTSDESLKELFMDRQDADESTDLLQDKAENDAEYALLLNQLWSKYKNSKSHNDNINSAPQGIVKWYKDKIIKKRYPDNWGPIAFKKKRSSNSDPIIPEYDTSRKLEPTEDANYNSYRTSGDDKDYMKEEYAIAFQPLDNDNFSDFANDEQYSYDTLEKRFPVSKRSSGSTLMTQEHKKRDTGKRYRSASVSNLKTQNDLTAFFGAPEQNIRNPVKRNSEHEDNSHESIPPTLTIMHHNNTHERNQSHNHDDDSHEKHGHNIHHPGLSGKEEVVHNHANESEKPINIKKKSIDWSQYFGIDKRKTKSDFFVNLHRNNLKKQYFDTFNKEVIYPLSVFKQHNNVKRNFVKVNPSDETKISLEDASGDFVGNLNKKPVNKDSKLDNIDKKLKNMEGLIVDEALQYSKVGEKVDSEREQEMKEKLLSRLTAAYSLEKMRKALKEFKQTLQTKLPVNVQTSPMPIDEAKEKRVAIKKEKVELDMNEIPTYSIALEKNDDFENEQGAGHYLNGRVDEQDMSERYMGGSGRHHIPVLSSVNAAGSCPVLAKIIQRCHGVDMLAGDRGQLFLPLCSLHRICYLCGESPPTTCDLLFLSEADTTCEGDMVCQRAARSALMALRELHDNLADELDGECEANSCLLATLKLNIEWQRALQR